MSVFLGLNWQPLRPRTALEALPLEPPAPEHCFTVVVLDGTGVPGGRPNPSYPCNLTFWLPYSIKKSLGLNRLKRRRMYQVVQGQLLLLWPFLSMK